MLADIEAGKIDIVITKDLSRLGRDYITSGEYTERYFPEHGVRYIAVNDGFDSQDQWNDIAPFKHVINEMYARDASKKIRSAFLTKMKDGAYIGNFAPYGYQKDPENKNHLLIDYETASIVQEIFEKAKDGARPIDIARDLNERGVPSPAMYRCIKHPHLDINHYTQRQEWTSSTICKILHNCVYLGHTAQGKTSKVSFKSKTTLHKTEDDWIIVPNTHQPLVTQTTYDIVRSHTVSRRLPPKSGFRNVFSGMARCAACGHLMSTTATRKKGSRYNLVCGYYKLYGSTACSNHFIDYDVLYQAVLGEIKKNIALSAGERAEMLDTLLQSTNTVNEELLRQCEIDQLTSRCNEIDRVVQRMYEDYTAGVITGDRFHKMSSGLETEQAELKKRLASLSLSPKDQTRETDCEHQFTALLDEVQDLQSLSVELLSKLVDRIEVEQGQYTTVNGKRVKTQKIHIFYKFLNQSNGQIIEA